MDRNWKRLRPRWKVKYQTDAQQPIGSKPVAELIPTTPGSPYVYATVELQALHPDYEVVGRVRPNDGPLMRALDKFIAEKLRELANEINATRRHEFDEKELNAVQRENQRLDQWKNQFLPSGGERGEGGIEGNGSGGKIMIDHAKPAKFSGAGHFWGIAPGTPPRVVRDRIAKIESTLKEALQYMETRGVDALFREKDRVLCERQDIERCIEFHKMIKERFSKEIGLLLS